MYVVLAAALLYFFPRTSLEWIASLVIAFIAAYFTVADQYWYAPQKPFMAWYVIDYIILQVFFHFLNKHLDRNKLTTEEPVRARRAS